MSILKFSAQVKALSLFLLCFFLVNSCLLPGSFVNAETDTTGVSDQEESTSVVPKEDELPALDGGRIVVGITQEPDFLDPQLAVAAGTKEILFNIFEGLVRMTPEGKFEPCLAESWQVEDKGKTYRFKLREGIKFHNGQSLQAEDVVYSLKRAAGLGEGEILLPELEMLDSVESAAGGREIIVKLKEANPDLPAFLTLAILPRDYTEQNTKPVGTGPFRFVSYRPQDSLTLARFEDYWQEDKPYLEEVVFRIYGDMDAAYLELLAGEIDIFPYLTAEKAHGLEDKYNLVVGGANMIQVMGLNNQAEKLQDPLVREAINLAIDRSQVREIIMGEYGRELVAAMTPSMGDYYNAELTQDFQADPEAARAKLKAAGLPEGFSLKLTVPANYLIHVDTANLIAAQLEKVGITVEIEPVEWGTWLERVYAGRDYEATIIALTFDYYTPVDVLNRYMQDAPNNFINYQNPAYDKLAKEAARELDQEKRIKLYHEMQKMLWEDQASAFLQEPLNLTVVKKGLRGYIQYPAYVQDMASVYFVDAAALEASRP